MPKKNPSHEAIKEATRIAIITVSITIIYALIDIITVSDIDSVWIPILTVVVRAVEKYNHERNKDGKNLVELPF